ncbi:hypothetical protein [Ktedonobacter racemifer]|uniref:hypothetical protein n=1 Tax=Ktedonobacter racemifer TaxID=363277 RepID=UPI0012FACE93|nr:hypothetical protein [Ktedonobacter racemifer]
MAIIITSLLIWLQVRGMQEFGGLPRSISGAFPTMLNFMLANGMFASRFQGESQWPFLLLSLGLVDFCISIVAFRHTGKASTAMTASLWTAFWFLLLNRMVSSIFIYQGVQANNRLLQENPSFHIPSAPFLSNFIASSIALLFFSFILSATIGAFGGWLGERMQRLMLPNSANSRPEN